MCSLAPAGAQSAKERTSTTARISPSRRRPRESTDRAPGDPYGLDGPIGEAFEGIEGVACEDLPRRPNSGGPADEQYSPKTPPADVSNPNDVVPNTTVKMMLNTGGPPNFAVGALCSWERPRWRDAVS